MHEVLFWVQCLYFFLPAYIANTIPGFLLGTAGGIISAYCQAKLHNFEPFAILGLTDYNRVNPLILGFLLGFGSLVGDSLGSFVKRRLRIRPGEHLWLFDELTMAAGAILFMIILYPTPSVHKVYIAMACIFITFVWHTTAAKIAYLLRIREARW